MKIMDKELSQIN